MGYSGEKSGYTLALAPHIFSPQKPYYIMREREREIGYSRLLKVSL